ncbi:hypothetical protein ADUPG1_008337 [Aduncisulcus paluster]|uniref:Uncharacterized protein n=1 Tax=Aduncisulcus paluster TaxID=2918883 RepID=A0ABQ5KRL3_9EUKA|nr:hypothetical protein ADUPG1_008337 [Aduncisulcus paluster]
MSQRVQDIPPLPRLSFEPQNAIEEQHVSLEPPQAPESGSRSYSSQSSYYSSGISKLGKKQKKKRSRKPTIPKVYSRHERSNVFSLGEAQDWLTVFYEMMEGFVKSHVEMQHSLVELSKKQDKFISRVEMKLKPIAKIQTELRTALDVKWPTPSRLIQMEHAIKSFDSRFTPIIERVIIRHMVASETKSSRHLELRDFIVDEINPKNPELTEELALYFQKLDASDRESIIEYIDKRVASKVRGVKKYTKETRVTWLKKYGKLGIWDDAIMGPWVENGRPAGKRGRRRKNGKFASDNDDETDKPERQGDELPQSITDDEGSEEDEITNTKHTSRKKGVSLGEKKRTQPRTGITQQSGKRRTRGDDILGKGEGEEESGPFYSLPLEKRKKVTNNYEEGEDEEEDRIDFDKDDEEEEEDDEEEEEEEEDEEERRNGSLWGQLAKKYQRK